MGRAWQYFKCNNCGKGSLLGAGNSGSYVCECKQTVYYSNEVEDAWLNEVDDNGKRIRMDFTGYNEEDCRRNAAIHFGCEKEDIQNYYIVQKSGLFKKFTICATRPIVYEKDEKAIRILMWEYDKRPRIWADINLENKTILYPCVLGEKKQSFDKVVGFRKSENVGACRNYTLILEPQGEVEFSFYPGYFENIHELIKIANTYISSVSHGMFDEKFYNSKDIVHDGNVSIHSVSLQITTTNFQFNGYMSVWKKENKLCFCDTLTYQGIEISLDVIKYYRLIGQKYVTTEISGGGGGGSSIKGAVIGGLIAGDVGAVIGSRKAVDEVKGTSTVHDEQVVLLYSTDLSQVLQFNSAAYKVFTKLIPEMDYEVVATASTDTKQTTSVDIKSAADTVRELKKLLDEGLISNEEFEKKRKELLGL